MATIDILRPGWSPERELKHMVSARMARAVRRAGCKSCGRTADDESPWSRLRRHPDGHLPSYDCPCD